jgi:serine/threonine protein kinase
MLDPFEKWERLSAEPLGSGGQGIVFRVRDKTRFNKKEVALLLQQSIPGIGGAGYIEDKIRHAEMIIDAIQKVGAGEDPAALGALKLLRNENEARDPERCEVRMKQEIDAMKQMSHPNLVRILDADHDYRWYVMKYYQNGTLNDRRDYYSGNIDRILEDFRPLVEAVAYVHEQGFVHRDIKPANVFIEDHGTLVLSDFGLVFEMDESGERLSGTEENVGTHAWMPPWLMEEQGCPTPAFDVFSLGKVLWWMTAPRGILQLWYYAHKPYDLELKFPDNPLMKAVNELIGKCVVQYEKDCLADAGQLLDEIDKLRSGICRRCVKGPYEQISEYANRLLDNRLTWEMCTNCSDMRISGGKFLAEVVGFNAKNNPNNQQGSEWRCVDSKGQAVSSLSFKVESVSEHWRAGFMIGEQNPGSKQPLPVHEGSLLFHTALTDGKYSTGAWAGKELVINEEMPSSEHGSISMSFVHDGSNVLTCTINGKTYPPFRVEPDWLEHITILAWADEVDFAVSFRELEIVPAFGLLGSK